MESRTKNFFQALTNTSIPDVYLWVRATEKRKKKKDDCYKTCCNYPYKLRCAPCVYSHFMQTAPSAPLRWSVSVVKDITHKKDLFTSTLCIWCHFKQEGRPSPALAEFIAQPDAALHAVGIELPSRAAHRSAFGLQNTAPRAEDQYAKQTAQ